MRKAFNEIKDTIHRFTGPNRICFCCGGQSTIRHHLIQLQNGGSNRRRNIVYLCDPCHEELHPWLKNQNLINVLLDFDADDADEPRSVEL